VAAALSGLDKRQKRTLVSLTALLGLGVGLALTAFFLRDHLIARRAVMHASQPKETLAAAVPTARAPIDLSAKTVLSALFGNFEAATQTALFRSTAPPEGWQGDWSGARRVSVRDIAAIGAGESERIVLTALTAPEDPPGCGACEASIGAALFAQRGGGWELKAHVLHLAHVSALDNLQERFEVTPLGDVAWALLLPERANHEGATREITRIVAIEGGAISLAFEGETAHSGPATPGCEACKPAQWEARPRFVNAAGDPHPQLMLEFSGVDAHGRAIGRTEQYRFLNGAFQLAAESGAPDPRIALPPDAEAAQATAPAAPTPEPSVVEVSR
jgi:hypothetical protein